jgi:P-type Cu+ transporter
MQGKSIREHKELICYHCGDFCRDDAVTRNEKHFCCTSCKLIYEILEENNLCRYYSFEKNPGISPKSEKFEHKYDFLEDEQFRTQILDFTDSKISTITFYIPQIHCSSCIWLLENLHKLNNGVLFSEVNFLEKKLYLKYSEEKTSLRKVVEMLDSIGYEPLLSLDKAEKEKKFRKFSYKTLYYKIGIAGFSFGNIMLLSFPDYLGLDRTFDAFFGKFIGIFNILLALPVFFYSSTDYFKSAYKGVRNKMFNIDVPLSLGIFVLFARSVWDVAVQTGPGYFDSFSGLVFFLLLGKLFQSKTYDTLNFERNYRSYFPLSVTIVKNKKETTIPVSKLKAGDRIIVRNNELIPADSILFRGNASIDYSFVTGESIPQDRVLGEIIYAGGRQIGNVIELEVLKEVSQSYLTQLWNNSAFYKEKDSSITEISNIISKYFTLGILLISIVSGLIMWLKADFNTAIFVFTSVLIVACPCALALSVPFTLGNTLRIFGKLRFYLKNTNVVERLSKITTIVFDKTGTITKTGSTKVQFFGRKLSEYDKVLIKALAQHSNHILSRKIYEALDSKEIFEVEKFRESAGKGISGTIDGNELKMGSREFTERITDFESAEENINSNQTDVFLTVNGKTSGYFRIVSTYREGLEKLADELSDIYDIHILSGDNSREKTNLLKVFASDKNMRFNQSPEQKLYYIKSLQEKGKKVLMVGDGLNDAGALKQSDAGITISDDVYNFSPACDAILDASAFNNLMKFLDFSKFSIKVIIASFVFSLVYNIIGLTFAVNAMLTPVIAAILMPVSSISVVLFATITTNLYAKRRGIIKKGNI